VKKVPSQMKRPRSVTSIRLNVIKAGHKWSLEAKTMRRDILEEIFHSQDLKYSFNRNFSFGHNMRNRIVFHIAA